MRPGFIVLALVATAPMTLSAQEGDMNRRGRPATPADSLAPTISAAEARAKLPAGVVQAAVSMHPADAEFVAAAVGSSDRSCVDAGNGGRIRAGDFVAAMSTYADNWALGRAKIMWISVRPETPRVPLVVKATRLDAAVEGRVYEVGTLNAPRYSSGVHLPGAGRWMMVATAGGAWGCFVVTVK